MVCGEGPHQSSGGGPVCIEIIVRAKPPSPSSLLHDLCVVMPIEGVGLACQRVDTLGALTPRRHPRLADVVGARQHRERRHRINKPHGFEASDACVGVVTLMGESRCRVGASGVGAAHEECTLGPAKAVDGDSPGYLDGIRGGDVGASGAPDRGYDGLDNVGALGKTVILGEGGEIELIKDGSVGASSVRRG